MASLILLNAASPSKMADDLIYAGHQVWEALDVSEVLFLQERERIDAVIIMAEVENAQLIERQLHGIVMCLKPGADAAYVHWELSNLFGLCPSTLQ